MPETGQGRGCSDQSAAAAGGRDARRAGEAVAAATRTIGERAGLQKVAGALRGRAGGLTDAGAVSTVRGAARASARGV